MARFALVSVTPLTLVRVNRLAEMYVLSPFVWRDGPLWRILVRAVPRRDDEPRLKIAEVWHGVSDDGLRFEMDIAPVIFPGPDPADLDGCEDPTVLAGGDGLRVWYTGYHEKEKTGRIMLARGAAPGSLEKQGIALDSAGDFRNPKEAAVVRAGDAWRMFFEYARDEASQIGEAQALSLDGPWHARRPGPIAPRPGTWDGWHLSPGPVIGEGTDAPVMFYNGATRDAKWRVGWAAFDADFSRLTDRSADPLIAPDGELHHGATDIAFAASAIEENDDIRIYFSQSDRDVRCATIRRD